MSRPRFQAPANFGGMRQMFSGPPNMNGPAAGPAPPRYGGFPNQFQSQSPRPRQPNNIWCGRPPQMNYFQNRPQFRNANPGQFQHQRNPNQNNFQNCNINRPHQNNLNHNQNFKKRTGQYYDRDDPGSHGNQHIHQRNQFQNDKKKQKMNKRDTEEHNQYFCDTCDRGFKTEDKYQEHLNQHQKCTHSGCPYIAAPKLVQLHIRLQHSNGLAKKIWQLESKEEIEKWRAERRKNFPTKENIMRKETEQEQRKSRGEVVETKTFGKMKGRNQRNKRQNNRKRQYNELSQQNDDISKQGSEDKRNDANKKAKTEDPVTKIEERQSTDGDPLSLLINDNSGSDEDELNTKESAVPKSGNSAVKDNIIGGLGMIVSSYDDDEEEEEDSVRDDTTEQQDAIQKQSSKNANSVVKKFNKNTGNKKTKRDLHNRKQKNISIQRRKTSSLLEKLLAKEIRHERNVILQCVYHIVRKDFFKIHENKSYKGTHTQAVTDIDDKVCD